LGRLVIEGFIERRRSRNVIGQKPVHYEHSHEDHCHMFTDEIRNRVKKTIAKVSGIDAQQIGDDDSFDTLELDSLSRIEILVELEREFKLNMSDEDQDANLVAEIQTVEHAVQLVHKNLATAGAT
jgi:acyl carrier protein